MAEKRYRNDINQVFDTIMEQNPKISPNAVELFSKIYYPIAILEITMEERTFEDFEFVPSTVLKLVANGAVRADDIADLTGLKPGYIQKVLDLLRGYGYVTNLGITDLGKESLEQNKKISLSAVKQKFQADALSGDLLRLGEQSSESNLEGVDEVRNGIPIVPHLEGISMDQINQQLAKADLQEYKKYQGDILNANVEKINAVRCTELDYVEAFMLKLSDCNLPVIMMHQYDAKRNEFKDRFRWQPVRLPDPSVHRMYGFASSIPCYEPESRKIIGDLYKMVCERACKPDKDKLIEIIEKSYPFDFSHVNLNLGNIKRGIADQVTVRVDASSFSVWTKFVFNFLERYNLKAGGFYYTDSFLNGLIVRFETRDPKLTSAIQYWQSSITAHPRRELTRFAGSSLINRDVPNRVDFDQLKEVVAAFEDTQDEES